MFKGTYRHRIDPKGRLPVPAAFRRALAERGAATVVVTLLDQCLAAYPRHEWARLEAQLARAARRSAGRSRRSRACWPAAPWTASLDVQGRILLPVRACARPRGSAGRRVVVGVLNRFEVWAPDAWSEFLRESERLLEDVTLASSGRCHRPAAAPERAVRPQAKPKR